MLDNVMEKIGIVICIIFIASLFFILLPFQLLQWSFEVLRSRR